MPSAKKVHQHLDVADGGLGMVTTYQGGLTLDSDWATRQVENEWVKFDGVMGGQEVLDAYRASISSTGEDGKPNTRSGVLNSRLTAEVGEVKPAARRSSSKKGKTTKARNSKGQYVKSGEQVSSAPQDEFTSFLTALRSLVDQYQG